ncbi:DUF4251 domain-containing protein [Pedobacter montanisoli]|uniref:DUF4251 domain-containing protein n=1 Tax=Pedobacter montanisoli TaxID=2923277 RepID=A0ABS9ZV89_9SPHI|nr:DUF4251 domain-containing protein [Pedobacter montanisoli]MCJ0742179.1 DUF4251 domain-containing protein [Pedobacter montanisoli]
MKSLKFLFVSLISIFITAHTFAQKPDEAMIAKIVEAKNFIFIADNATPSNSTELNRIMSKIGNGMATGSINLNGQGYTLKIAPDSVIAYLPYYGRSYNAPIGQNEGGVKFKSKDFKYKSKKNKKGSWDIEININDVNENYRMSLNIGKTGYASLSLSSNNKQNITYNGYIRETTGKD